jgi:pyruvate formate lyase activating enzyme
MRDTPPTPPATLHTARRIGKEQGLRYVYTGNVHDPAGQSTYCHACSAALIGRDWYDLTHWGLTPDGRCRGCGAPCAGVFEPTPGRWGRRRQSVSVAPISPSPFLTSA